MELAKIFCVTRDEYDLIEDFILYYGYFLDTIILLYWIIIVFIL